MRIRVPYLIQDPQLTSWKGVDPIEWLPFEREMFCLDGPVTRRVAVLDFEPLSGALNRGCAFIAPATEKESGSFDIKDTTDFTAVDFIQVNAFVTVLSTLYMYEEKDVLGREVEWGFDAPQLFIVPRAGEWANAFYQRESHSIQLFYFTAPGSSGSTVFTALSQDIIAHETGHAILDGIAPDLYNTITPQSLALHEAVADLTALLVALRSRKLVEKLLEQTGGRIDGENALSALAEEFGTARATGRGPYLRSMWNDYNLDPSDSKNGVQRTDPHGLSEVLSGALYRVFARLHEEYRSRRAAEENITEYSASGWALFVAREHFKRLVLRSLDYLPPGEISFADYGRAILASDQASYPSDSTGRSSLVDEFVRRRIVANGDTLDVRTNYQHPAVLNLDLDILVSSDWAAYEFVENNREFLGIPPDVRFRVRPRIRAVKKFRGATDFEEVTECILKVSWDREEANPKHPRLPPRRQITVGTTLVIGWEDRKVRVLLTSEAAMSPAASNDESNAAVQQRRDRDEMLRHLAVTHALDFGIDGEGPFFDTAARIETSGDLMRVRSSGRMLHILSPEEQ